MQIQLHNFVTVNELVPLLAVSIYDFVVLLDGLMATPQRRRRRVVACNFNNRNIFIFSLFYFAE